MFGYVHCERSEVLLVVVWRNERRARTARVGVEVLTSARRERVMITIIAISMTIVMMITVDRVEVMDH